MPVDWHRALVHQLPMRGAPARHTQWKDVPGIGTVPASWEVVRLGNVAEVAFSSVDKKTVDGEIPVELCNYTDVFYNRRIRPGMEFMTATASPVERRRWALRKGDVLFTKDSETPDEIGIPAYVTADMPKVLCGYHLGLARPRAELADGAYLAELLRSPRTAGQFARIANGVTRFGLTLGATSSLKILLPPLPEQRAIAAVLDSIEDTIERTEAVIAATEELRRALLHELLTCGVPGWHSEWRDVPGIGTVPACWDVMTLGQAADVRSGQADPRDPEFQQLAFIAPDDIEPATGRLITRRTVADAKAISGKYKFDEHDVIYSKIRPYLMKAYLPEEHGLCSADVYPIRPRAGLIRGYFVLVLLSPRFTEYARTCSDRTGIPKINRKELLQFRFVLPAEDEQERIAAAEAALQQQWNSEAQQLETLRRFKAALSDSLLSGRIRVREARNV